MNGKSSSAIRMRLERVYILRMGYKEDVDREWRDVAESIMNRIEERIREMLTEDPEVMDEIIREVNEEFNTNLENPSDVGNEFFIQFGKHKLSDVDKHVIKLKVLGLLEEVEKEKKTLETKLKKVKQLGYVEKEDGRTIQRCILLGSIKELQSIEQKIKKWFGDAL